MSFEGINSPARQNEGNENIDGSIRAECVRLGRNAEQLKTDLAEHPDQSQESLDRLASTAKKLIIGASALVAIPLIASMLPPEIAPQIAEWKAATQDFIKDHFVLIFGVVMTIGVVPQSIDLWWSSKKEKEE